MSQPAPRPSIALKWIAIDLDGTLADGVWTPEEPVPTIGPPIAGTRTKCWELVEAGYKLIVHTSRSWSDYEAIEWWLTEHGYPPCRIQCGKLLARVYIDDRNGAHINAGSWLPEVEEEVMSNA